MSRSGTSAGHLANRLLPVGVLVLLVLGMVMPGLAAAEPNQAGASYIIVFKDTVDVPASVPEVARAYGLQPGFVYEHALRGMSAVVPPGRLEALQRDPRVAYVVEDMERSISAQTVPTGIKRIFADGNTNIDIDGTDDWRVDVDVAVIDTGVDFQHPDLNVLGGINCAAGNIIRVKCIEGGDDDHYHGTHVAGTIGAIDNGIGVVGVAPGARIWSVKVLNAQGSGYTSWIVAGIDWVAANAGTIEVANMSLGGSGYNQAEYDAIQGAVNKGVAFAVAAGNEDSDARNYSPGGFDNVLSVSALADFNGQPGGGAAPTCRTDQDDTLADFSNWGPAVDIAAPGVCILSTYPLEKGEYGTISGTSMASPHAAGALALLASANNPGSATDVYNLYNQVKNAGNFDWIDDSGDGIQEPLLDVSDAAIFSPALVPGSGTGPTPTPTNTTVPPTPTNTAVPSTPTNTPVIPTPTPAPPSQFILVVTARAAGPNRFADLTWSGAASVNVDVYRGDDVVATTPNDGAYTDKPPKTTTSAKYKVCEAGTQVCSNEATATWLG